MKKWVPMEDHHPELIRDGVAAHEQTMTIEKAFWVFFSGNISVGTVMVGVIVAGMGLGFWYGLLALVLGNLLGALPPALTATMGPRTRLSQMESSRLALGKAGSRFPSFLSWFNCLGWDAVNNVPSAFALVALATFYGFTAPFWITLAGLVFIQGLIGIYGHHLVQVVGKYVGYLFFATFTVIGLLAFRHTGTLPAAPGPVTFKTFYPILSLGIGAIMGWCTQTADYTRYLPARTPAFQVFRQVYLGNLVSIVFQEILGMVIAGTVASQTPQETIHSFQLLAGKFAPIALVLMALCSIACNAVNDNSAAYCLISSGFRISRRIAAVLGACVSYAIAVYGSGGFSLFLENFLFLMLYWVAPWFAIVFVDWLMTHRTDDSHRRGWTKEATIFCVVTGVTLVLFSVSPVYTGPVTKWLGGVEIGYYVGLVWAGVWTWGSLRKRRA